VGRKRGIGKNRKRNVRIGLRRTVTLHDGQELDDDLGGRTDHDLALAGLLGVVDSIEAIVEDGSLDHFGGIRRFSSGEEERLRYLQRRKRFG
jgi:hypothetical protein